jgi:hypothetical protein
MKKAWVVLSVMGKARAIELQKRLAGKGVSALAGKAGTAGGCFG